MRICVTDIQRDSRGQFNIFGGDSIGYFEKESSYQRVFNPE